MRLLLCVNRCRFREGGVDEMGSRGGDVGCCGYAAKSQVGEKYKLATAGVMQY